MKTKQIYGCTCVATCKTLTKGEDEPRSCPTIVSADIVRKSMDEGSRDGSYSRNLWQAFVKLTGHGAAQRSRLEHIMEFSYAAGYKKIGLAGCARYLPEMSLVKKLLKENGFDSIYVGCKFGNVHFADIAIDKDSDWTLCNPMGQAALLNEWGADINVQFGLCMGHDLIFNHYSNAPTTVLVVKEKISEDNTLGTLREFGKGVRECRPYNCNAAAGEGGK